MASCVLRYTYDHLLPTLRCSRIRVIIPSMSSKLVIILFKVSACKGNAFPRHKQTINNFFRQKPNNFSCISCFYSQFVVDLEAWLPFQHGWKVGHGSVKAFISLVYLAADDFPSFPYQVSIRVFRVLEAGILSPEVEQHISPQKPPASGQVHLRGHVLESAAKKRPPHISRVAGSGALDRNTGQQNSRIGKEKAAQDGRKAEGRSHRPG